MSRVICLLFIMLSITLSAQKNPTWKDLGGAEKVWLIFHPFSAKKAKELTSLAIHKSDSIHKEYKFPNPKSGGRKDALRHAYWMALLSNEIGAKRALWLGWAHEKKGKKDFKKGKKEDGELPDKTAMEMDLFNNEFGARIGKYCYDCDKEKLLETVMEALKKGELKIIKQNNQGQFLNQSNHPIPSESWKGRWENERVLVNSAFGL